jgi:aminopeptidase
MKSIELAARAHRVMASYLAVQAGERVLVVADTMTSPSLPVALAAQARVLGADPAVIVMVRRTRSGEEPPEHVAAAMRHSDVVISVASTSMYHTDAKGRAQKAGVRGAFNAPCDEDAWVRGAMTADFVQIREVAERLAARLRGANELRVTSPAGTDVSMSITGRSPVGWLTGICKTRGQVSAYPGGEVSLPPVEGTANGRVVIETVMTDIGKLTQPITWMVRDGQVVAIEGGAEAAALRAHIAGIANATNIAEIGIGLNPVARLGADITEFKKKLGTAHMAMGDSAGEYGGAVVSDVHLDGMILDCCIEIDGEVVVADGVVRVPQ